MAKELEKPNPYHVTETRRDPNTGELATEDAAEKKPAPAEDSFDLTDHA
jgi:hypothetical protein